MKCVGGIRCMAWHGMLVFYASARVTIYRIARLVRCYAHQRLV